MSDIPVKSQRPLASDNKKTILSSSDGIQYRYRLWQSFYR